MKRIIRLVLSIFIFTSIFLYAPFIEDKQEYNVHIFDEHAHHVHAWSVGDDCPYCSTGATPVIVYGTVVKLSDRPATCTAEGLVQWGCNNCGVTVGTDTIPALGHNYNWSTSTAATCTSGGTQTGTCTRCNDTTTRSIAALGHSYSTSITKAATCLETGIETTTCSRCGDSSEKTIKALGHNYRTVVTKKATCEETGSQTSTCTRCNHKYNTTLKALGHDWKEEKVEPTCTQDGYFNKTCKRCNKEEKEVLKTLGHDLKEYTVVKEATCEQDGLKQAACQRCSEVIDEVIPKLGHSYPEEWTIEKETGFFHEGLETKTCATCQNKIEQAIPKKDSTPLVVGGVSGGVSLAALAFFALKRKSLVSGARLAKKALKPELVKPSIEDKSIVLSSDDEELIKLLKSKHYLDVTTCQYEEIIDTVNENEPDALVCSIDSSDKLNEIIEYKKEDLKDYDVALIVRQDVIDENKEVLDKLVKDKQIINYIASDYNNYNILVKLIAPILKPNLKSDETLENIGMLSDVLGIPGISTVIDLFVTGRDIKTTLDQDELALSDKATIISDLAYILGFETVSDVVNLVNDIEDIKASLDKEAGANQAKSGIKASKDVIDVVSDLIDRD